MTEQQLDAFADDDLQQLLIDLEQLPPEQRSDAINRIPAQLQSLMALFESELKGHVKQPENLAQRLVIELAHYLGGIQTYIPRNDRLKTLLRNIAIYNAHNKGASIRSLAESHRLTDMQIYSIIKEQTQIERARRQFKLF
ncbi:Mor transcription activator family protein [Alishewanella jeotgali]|uniref:Mu-like phage C protein, positive regulator of late transcription n=1 Tax=Alishewanella jeotgali KCTC 22429 TaxID=1129374 RepID=H3ZIH0_9ALTE|nr:Mor transcription activator family protein [Alishewanella jeotgali]EHR39620.1 Mu-like phage C protein, positive regulator of late transcription [Alishewanella jeotgali KCTC 22429]